MQMLTPRDTQPSESQQTHIHIVPVTCSHCPHTQRALTPERPRSHTREAAMYSHTPMAQEPSCCGNCNFEVAHCDVIKASDLCVVTVFSLNTKLKIKIDLDWGRVGAADRKGRRPLSCKPHVTMSHPSVPKGERDDRPLTFHSLLLSVLHRPCPQHACYP